MDSVYYKNGTHYYHACKKLLLSKQWFDELHKIADIKRSCIELYEFSVYHEQLFKVLSLRLPMNIHSYFIYTANTKEEFYKNWELYINLMEEYNAVIGSYHDGITNVSHYIKTYPLLYKHCYIDKRIKNHPVWNTETKKYEYFCGDELIAECNKIVDEYGIYVFLDIMKRPIYVGKSSNLGERIPTSLKERFCENNIYYVSYAITYTKSDAHIYEMYYISKWKPPANAHGMENDEPSVSLPDIKFSEPIPVAN